VGEPIYRLGLHPGAESEVFAERFERALSGECFEDLVVKRQTKNGDEIHVSLSTEPLHDSSGDISGIVTVATDVTGRVERERRFESLSKGFPDLCFVLDEDGRYREVLSSPVSENYLLGDSNELVGKSVTDVLPSEQAQLVMEQIEQMFKTGDVRQFHFRLSVPAGQRLFEARIHPLSDPTAEKRLVSMVVRDITDLRGEKNLRGVPET
jgi:PAS domain S-box-containing protein